MKEIILDILNGLSRKTKIYLIILLAVLVFALGMSFLGQGPLTKIFIWKIGAERNIFTAKLLDIFQSSKPIRNWEVEDLKITAESAIAVEIDNSNQQKVLFKKEEDKKLPIASLTKLMTALVVLDDYNLNQTTKISEGAVSQAGTQGELKAGEILSVENLLYILLVESSNDAAYALSEVLGTDAFVALMNLKARNIELNNTRFINPTGLDSENPEDPTNYSSTGDLIKLVSHLLEKHPSMWKILSLTEFHLYRPDGTYHHKLTNTNELLGEIPEIIGGKTGWTPRAKDCLLLVLKSPKENGFLIYVILGAENRFEEMRKLIDWTQKAYQW